MRGSLLDSEWREKLPPICTGCGYNLTGIKSERCPECGRRIVWTELKKNAKTLYHSLRQVEDVNLILGVGVYLGAAGAAFVLVFWFMEIAALGRLAGFFLGIATFGTGVQVFRARRFPEWADEFLPAKPNYIKGAAVAMFGLAVIALAVFLPPR